MIALPSVTIAVHFSVEEVGDVTRAFGLHSPGTLARCKT